MPTTAVRRFSSRLSRSIGLFDQIFDQCPAGEAGEGEHVSLHRFEPLSDRRCVGSELFNDGAHLGAGGVGVALSEHRADERGDHRPSAVMSSGEEVEHRMDTTALPGRASETAANRRVGERRPVVGCAKVTARPLLTITMLSGILAAVHE